MRVARSVTSAFTECLLVVQGWNEGEGRADRWGCPVARPSRGCAEREVLCAGQVVTGWWLTVAFSSSTRAVTIASGSLTPAVMSSAVTGRPAACAASVLRVTASRTLAGSFASVDPVVWGAGDGADIGTGAGFGGVTAVDRAGAVLAVGCAGARRRRSLTTTRNPRAGMAASSQPPGVGSARATWAVI